MIHFNELRFSNDNKCLIIDVAIDDYTYYENVVIDSIIIDNQNTFVVNGPSSTPIYTYQVPKVSVLDSMKHVRLELPLNVFEISCFDMLFVYVIASGTPAADTPCGFDNSKIIGTVIDLKGLYSNMLHYIKQIEDNCEIPKNFIDTILKYKALELCIRTGNYPLAIKYWTKYLSNMVKNPIIKTCNCHG